MLEKHKILEGHLLECLSFYEAMRMDHIYLDLDQGFLEAHPELTMQDLKIVLSHLEKSKRVKKSTDGEDTLWIRLYPKKSFLKKIRLFLKL